jgi:hypothetical protein
LIPVAPARPHPEHAGPGGIGGGVAWSPDEDFLSVDLNFTT